MKKLIILPITVLMVTVAGMCQTVASYKEEIKVLNRRESLINERKKHVREELRKLEGTTVSESAKAQFVKDFGDIAGAGWTRTDYNEVTFVKDGQAMTAVYDDGAKLMGTVTNKSFTDIPANAQDIINKKYSGYLKVSVIFYDDNELNTNDITVFGEPVSNDNYFVELKNNNTSIVLKINQSGEVSFFTRLY